MRKGQGNKTIDNDTVRYVASLSRLSFTDEELKGFKGQLSEILGYIDQLDEADTSATVPTTHAVSSVKNVFREDQPGVSLSPDEGLANAPARKGDFFTVPKIIKD